MPKALESPVSQISSATPVAVEVTNTVNVETPGPMLFLQTTIFVSDPGSMAPQTLIVNQKPVTGTWRLRRFEVMSRANGSFKLSVNGILIRQILTGASAPSLSFPIEPWVEVSNAGRVDVEYEQGDGPSLDIDARVYYTEHP